MLVAISSNLKFSVVLATRLDKFQIWEVSCCGLVVENRIKREVFWLNCVLVVNTIIAMYSVITHMIPLEDDKELFFPLAIFEEFFPRWEKWLSALYRAGFLLMPAAMQTTCYVITYIGSQMRFQFYILIHFLENINSDYNTTNPERLILDPQCQEEIKKRIIFCIKRHTHIFR
jgi:hypothetical protein